MPELPEVETVKLGLSSVMDGARINSVKLNRPDLRFPFPENFKKRLEGETITSLGRRAKYLMADLSSGDVLVMHLGMSGSFRIDEGNSPSNGATGNAPLQKNVNHDHVNFELTATNGQTKRIIFNDPRRFGYMDLIPRSDIESHRLFANLGVEPLGNSFNAEYLCSRLNGKNSALKTALLDQRIIAGLGNIYVCESLWRAKLSPFTPAGKVSGVNGRPTKRAELLVESIRAILTEAIGVGGSTLRDHVSISGKMGYFQHVFAVYGREGEKCSSANCKGEIVRATQSGRSTYYCDRCQSKGKT